MTLPIIDPIGEKQAFDTHLNYAICLSSLTAHGKIDFRHSLKKINLPDLKTKNSLIGLTLRSLKDEYGIVQIDRDYSYASTSWLPIKSYYLLFNMLLTIEYILTSNPKSYTMTHTKCLQSFTKMLKDGDIMFTNPVINSVFDSKIFNFKELPGANLSRMVDSGRMFQMAMRKASMYKKDDWKRKSNINLRTNFGKQKMKDYLDNFEISIFEFPYYMRIRSNYRDFAFIEGVSSLDTKRYFEAYFSFTMNLFNLLETFKDELVKMRV